MTVGQKVKCDRGRGLIQSKIQNPKPKVQKDRQTSFESKTELSDREFARGSSRSRGRFQYLRQELAEKRVRGKGEQSTQSDNQNSKVQI